MDAAGMTSAEGAPPSGAPLRQAPFSTAPSIKDEIALNLLVEAAGAGPADTMLDVACGGGLVVCAFAKVVAHATGIDITPAMIERSRQLARDKGLTNVTWNELGPLQPSQSREMTIRIQVSPDTAAGRFNDIADATGTCGPAGAEAGNGVSVPLSARVSLNLPEVVVVRGAEAKLTLPRTGGVVAGAPAFMLLGLGLGLRRLSRRRR